MVVAADIAGHGQLIADEEPPHQEQVRRGEHHIEAGRQAVMPLVEAKLAQLSLLFPLSLFRQGAVECRPALVRPVLWREVEPGEDPFVQRFGQIVLELLDNDLLADQREPVAVTFAEEAVPFAEINAMFQAAEDGPSRSR